MTETLQRTVNPPRGSLAYMHRTKPDVSIVIPAHNEQRTIETTISSLARAIRHTRKHAEVIIVDNASTDDTAGLAERAGARVIHEPQKGVSFARQRGLEAADAPMLLITDADTHVPPTWIDAHLRHYDDPRVLGVAGRIEYDNVHPLYHIYRACAAITQGSVSLLRKLGLSSSDPLRGQSGGNCSYRRADALKIGYAPGINLGEDMLMGMRLAENGIVTRDASPDITVVTDGRRFRTARNVTRLARKKVKLLLGGKLYRQVSTAMDFEDIRE